MLVADEVQLVNEWGKSFIHYWMKMRQMRDHNVNFRFVGLMGSCNRQQLESLCESIEIHKEFIYVGINIDQNEKDEAETQQKEEVVKTANETSPLPLFAVEWAEGKRLK